MYIVGMAQHKHPRPPYRGLRFGWSQLFLERNLPERHYYLLLCLLSLTLYYYYPCMVTSNMNNFLAKMFLTRKEIGWKRLRPFLTRPHRLHRIHPVIFYTKEWHRGLLLLILGLLLICSLFLLKYLLLEFIQRL